jgi:hypothetical protein
MLRCKNGSRKPVRGIGPSVWQFCTDTPASDREPDLRATEAYQKAD